VVAGMMTPVSRNEFGPSLSLSSLPLCLISPPLAAFFFLIIVIEGVSKAESSFLCVSTGDIVRATVGCCYDICLECVECI
jgi:hypothetical protein